MAAKKAKTKLITVVNIRYRILERSVDGLMKSVEDHDYSSICDSMEDATNKMKMWAEDYGEFYHKTFVVVPEISVSIERISDTPPKSDKGGNSRHVDDK